MKTIICVSAIVFLFLSSCRKEDAASVSGQAPHLQMRSAGANPYNTTPINDSGDFIVTASIWNSCTGEIVNLSGPLHYELHGMVSDRRITFKLHFNYANVKGVGQTSGTKYVATQAFNYSEMRNDFNEQHVFQQRGTQKFISQGSSSNFTIENDWHLTINALGEVAFFFTTGGDVLSCQN